MGLNMGQMGNRVVAGETPGTIYIPGVGWQKVTDWTDTVIYDSEIIPAGAIPAGTVYNFFRNLNFTATLARKSELYTTMTTPNQMAKDWRAIVYNISFQCKPGSWADDVQAIIGGGYSRFITGNQKIEREGALWMFPSPFGISGFISQDGLGVASEKSALNNGAASAEGVGKQMIVDLVDQMTFEASVRFDDAITLANMTYLYCVLRAYINKPVR